LKNRLFWPDNRHFVVHIPFLWIPVLLSDFWRVSSVRFPYNCLSTKCSFLFQFWDIVV
jgi:hypothetical protein